MTIKQLLAILMGWVLLGLNVLPVYAQSAIVIDSNEAWLNFPRSIQFTLKVHSDAPIEQVELIYRTNGRSCLSTSARKEIEIKSATTVNAKWIWDLLNSGNLPPGAVVTWQWQIRDAAGNTLLTPEQRLEVVDDYYDWHTLKSGVVTVSWSEGDWTFGQLVLNTAVDSLARLVKETGIPRPEAVRMLIYPSSQDLRESAVGLPSWAGGVAFPDYGTVMIGVAPDDKEYVAEVVPHELAHMVVDQRISNCVGNDLPTWLSEGLAVFAEGPTSVKDKEVVKSALERKDVPALETLTAGFSGHSNEANLSYAQSGVVVTYLVDTYGPKKLDELLEKVKQGVHANTALSAVYGLDTNGVDRAWRASLGYGSAPDAATATPTPKVQRTSVPTLALYASPTATALPATATVIPVTSTPLPSTPEPSATSAAPTTPADGAGGTPWAWIIAGGLAAVLAVGMGILFVRRSKG